MLSTVIEYIFMIPIVYLIVVVLGEFFNFLSKSILKIDMENTIWFFVWPILVVFLYFVYYYSKDNIKKYKEDQKPCAHGVNGGQTKMLCSVCRAEAEQKRLQAERIAEIERLEEAKRQAERERQRRINLQQEDFLRNQIDWKKFEDTVAELFRQLGYQVKQTAYSNDGGKDAIMWKDNKKYLLECKQYAKDKPIGRPYLQKFFAAMQEEKAAKGFFVNTGTFASTAYEYAKKSRIELIDMNGLIRLMKQAFGEPQLEIAVSVEPKDKTKKPINYSKPIQWNGNKNISEQQQQLELFEPKTVTPKIVVTTLKVPDDGKCPHCQSKLQERKVKNTTYLVCSRYPDCPFATYRKRVINTKRI